MAYVTKKFEEALKSVLTPKPLNEEITLDEGLEVKASGKHKAGGELTLTKKMHTDPQEPEQWAVNHRTFKADGSRMGGKFTHKTLHTGSKDEMTSKFNSLKEDNDEFEGLTEEQLEDIIESFESKLEKARAKLAKKPKDDYDFTGFKDAEDRRKEAGGIKVSGSYGKTYQGDADDLDTPKGTVKGTQPEAVKRGRGRPRGSKNR